MTTTGPASIDPDTGKPYGYLSDKNDKGFPIVTIRDFIEVQKKLVDSLGIKKLHMVGGASMGGIQTYEWAAVYPDMVGRIMPVISSAEPDAGLIDWLDIWAMPIRLDPKWNGGDYYGKRTAARRLCASLEDRHPARADQCLGHGCVRLQVGEGRREPATSRSPTATWSRPRSTTPAWRAPRRRTPTASCISSGPTSCLPKVPPSASRRSRRPALLIYSPGDLVFPGRQRAAHRRGPQGQRRRPWNWSSCKGNRGHLDGVLNIKQAEKTISGFLAK